MTSEILCTSLLYGLISLLLIFPPQEAVSAGLTVDHFLQFWLGTEESAFIQYHVQRSAMTLLTHCLLLPGYFIALLYFHPEYWNDKFFYSFSFEVGFIISLIPFLVSCILIFYWSRKDWKNHPLTKTLSLYTDESSSINSLRCDINNEYIRVDKVSTDINSVSRIICTQNWLIKVTSYHIYLISLQDAVLVIEDAQETTLIPNATSAGHMVNIRVASTRQEIKSFSFRINSLLWSEIQRKLPNPVVNPKEIIVHQTLADRFAKVFEETVINNPKVEYHDQLEPCIGCMSVAANVKLIRRCRLMNENSDCTPCSCRPMWCVSCLGKWFAARQDQSTTSTWLSSKAPCPTCRSKFCLIDVQIIQS